MPAFSNKDLAELAHQLLLSPKHKRLSQIKGAETLLSLVSPSKTYPYEMVCFHITGYRNRRGSPRPGISGEKLIPDLVNLAEHITRRNAIPVSELDEEILTCEDAAQRLRVSTKTIRRWRRRGLMAFRAVFPDGVSRLVHLRLTIDRFVGQNQALVERGASFSQLTETEKEEIVRQARLLLERRRVKLHVAAKEIARKTGRAVETIRYTLRRFDAAHPDQALFSGDGLPAAPEGHLRIWQAHQAGKCLAEIAQAEDRPEPRVAAIIRELTARQLKAQPVVFVFNELFDAPNAEAIILEPPRPAGNRAGGTVRAPRDLPAYLRSLYQVPLMTPEQEVDAFRRYNFLKYRLAGLIEALDVCKVSQRELDLVAELTHRIELLRQEIVKANLRLVVSIAKKHVGWSPRFFEVISDGNMSLLRAVEKFDFSRGFRFSTYASWAIMKNYARTVPEEHYHFTRYMTGQDELLEATADHREAPGGELDSQRLSAALKEGMSVLSDRERDIVTSHFGLFGRGPSKTLEELGRQFGVTKERVRQIELRAIGKMKRLLSPALADMLTE